VKDFRDCLFCKGATPPPGGRCKGGCGNQAPTRHTCHAEGCTAPVEPRMFMCLPHWRMVPKPLQQRIWANYVPGQETKKNPTRGYLAVANEAIRLVAEREGRA
jgi:hypothetical protein